MPCRFTELRCKEVICVSDGRRLGFISDVQVEVSDGVVCALIVPGPCRFFGLFGPKGDYVIPWKSIRRIGPDIVLVDIRPEECCIPKGNRRFFQ